MIGLWLVVQGQHYFPSTYLQIAITVNQRAIDAVAIVFLVQDIIEFQRYVKLIKGVSYRETAKKMSLNRLFVI